MIVRLTPAELLQASIVGCMRHVQNMRNGKPPRFGANETHGFGLHITGTIGELAVAKHRGMFWSGSVGNYDANDVGPYEVRTAKETDYNGRLPSLIMHPDDKDDSRYFLVVPTADQFEFNVIGSIMGRDGKNQKYWRDTARPAFFVPAADLT